MTLGEWVPPGETCMHSVSMRQKGGSVRVLRHREKTAANCRNMTVWWDC